LRAFCGLLLAAYSTCLARASCFVGFSCERLEMANKAGRMFLAVQGMRRVVG
jgi:hypothetical protein